MRKLLGKKSKKDNMIKENGKNVRKLKGKRSKKNTGQNKTDLVIDSKDKNDPFQGFQKIWQERVTCKFISLYFNCVH